MNTTPYTALLIEDDALFAMLVRNILEQHHYKVIQVDNSEDAIKAYKKNQFNIIFSDIQLPNSLNGFEIAKRIRLLEKISGKHTPIIGMSSDARAERQQLAFEAGMDRFYDKAIMRKMIPRILEEFM